MKLLILESPNKVKTLYKLLPDGFDVIASVGHITHIPPDKMNINVSDGLFRPVIKPVPGKLNIMRAIRDKAASCDEVFICTDPDREGERIAWDILCLIKDKSKVKRAEFHEITKKAVTKAVANPRELDMDMVNSQFTRQILDRLIGYTVSPMLWKNVREAKSAGRVQSVALRLVAEREFEIESFTPEVFWDIPVTFKIGKEEVEGIVVTKDQKNRIDDVEVANLAKKFIEESKPIVKTVVSKMMDRSPKPPFDTASLQKQASSTFGWSGKKTMEVAQKVYEAGYCTYHRTDSFVVSDEAYESCKEFIESEYGPNYVPETRPVYSKKSRSQEAHECIRPTSMSGASWVEGNDLGKDEQALYDMIRSRFIASQMASMKIEKTTVIVGCGKCNVVVEGKSVKFDGWSIMSSLQGKEVFLPKIEKGDVLELVNVYVKEHSTRPSDRFNDGTLVSKMEKEGVGRPSTWAVLVDTLLERGYVTKEGKNFKLTYTGRKVYEFLMSKFDTFFMDIGFTSAMEDELENISQGESDRLKVIRDFYSRLDELINAERNEAWARLSGQLSD